jgi:hypothetical protein
VRRPRVAAQPKVPMSTLFPDSPDAPAEGLSGCITITGSRDVDPEKLHVLCEPALGRFLGQNRHWLVGGAVGVDHLVAEWLMTRSERVTGVVPFTKCDQPKAVQDTLDRLTGGCVELCLNKSKPALLKRAYLDRNEYMVDRSRVVVAFWNGEKGGTWQTIQYSLKQRCETHVHPV